MKWNVKKLWIAMTVIILTVVTVPALFSNTILEIRRLKAQYDELYERYTKAIEDSNQAIAQTLANEVSLAKRRYDEARSALSLSNRTKESIKKGTKKIKDTVKVLFANGEDSNPASSSFRTGKILEGFAEHKIEIDGDNFCGQFAMTSVFNGMGINKIGQDLYKDTNPAGIFTAPSTIVEHLNMNGIDAYQKHNSGINDIIAKIDAGFPVMLLVGTENDIPHWITVYGYDCDESGNVKSFKMRDSYWGKSGPESMNVDELEKAWNSPFGDTFASNLCGYKNLLIDIKGTREPLKSPNSLNFNFNTATEDNIAGGINDVTTGFKNLSPARVGGGLTKCILGIPGAVAGITGNGINSLSNHITDWGQSKLKEDGIGNKIAGGAAVFGGVVGKAAGWVAKTTGNALSGIASVAGNFVNKLEYVFK